MTKLQKTGLGFMALAYIAAGINHFVNVQFYQPIMPPYIPFPGAMIALSGVIEMSLGLMLIPERTRKFAGYAIIAMLTVFLSVHWYMWTARDTVFATIPTWILLGRLPLQFLAMMWAHACANYRGQFLPRR